MIVLNFTQIPSTLNYPKSHKAELSSIHSDLVSVFLERKKFSQAQKRIVINTLNTVSCFIIQGDAFPNWWDSKDTSIMYQDLINYADSIGAVYSDDSVLGDLFIDYSDVIWDLPVTESDANASKPDTIVNPQVKPTEQTYVSAPESKTLTETPKENLWLKPRDIPRYDVEDKPWLRVNQFGMDISIRKSYPAIPLRQRDITISTDVDKMTDRDVDNLFPKQFIRTRKPCMYEPVEGYELDPTIGLILKVNGFSREQIIKNIIQYPHLYIVRRNVNGEVKNFYADIEINGELQPIEAVWDTLEDTRGLPKTKEYMQEYVIRRYLLERDIKHVDHKYPMTCDLRPYLTLFMPKDDYASYGFTNIGRDHVRSRVSYLQSLNPILRSVRSSGTSYCVSECPFAEQCTDQECSAACPKNVEIMYLLERNRIKMTNPVFKTQETLIEKAKEILHSDKKFVVIESLKVVEASNILTYVACCERWKGNSLNCSVYHLNFSEHTSAVQKSWTTHEITDATEYEQIWMKYAPVLIISNLDYVQFIDNITKILLDLIRDRESEGKKTIIVSPKINTLVGKGQLFDLMKNKFREAVMHP